MSDKKITFIKTKDLLFDPDNPRFYRLNASSTDIIDEMIDSEGVQDLMLSIGQKGYFPGEPLLVVPDSGGFVVVEGNRRLAAVKLLNQELPPPPRRKKSINTIIEEVEHQPPIELPCLVYTSRSDILRYLGYRHITGIQEWDSLSKARYLAQLRDEFYPNIPLEQQLKFLAKDIGSRPDYVGQLLTSLNLYSVAEDKILKELSLSDKDVKFSLLTTALGYNNICLWLGLEDKKDIEMPNLNEQNLRDLFAWMFIKDQQGYTILGESRRISEMAAVVNSAEATKVLKETGDLSEAYIFTDGPDVAFGKVLQESLDRLTTA